MNMLLKSQDQSSTRRTAIIYAGGSTASFNTAQQSTLKLGGPATNVLLMVFV